MSNEKEKVKELENQLEEVEIKGIGNNRNNNKLKSDLEERKIDIDRLREELQEVRQNQIYSAEAVIEINE